MEVEGIDEARRFGEIIEWTLDHHKLFVDTWMQLGTDFIVDTPDGRGFKILIQHLNTSPLMKAVPPSALFGHVMRFGVLQHKTQNLSSSSLSSCLSQHPSLMEEFAGLNGGQRKECVSWTIEVHSSFVEAVAHVGGLDDARPHDILRLMVDKEQGRQKLTEHMVITHLWRLRDLQKRTQNDIFSSLDKENIVWTMEHHKLFVETWLGLGDAGISNGLIELLIKSSAAMKRVPRNALVCHMMRLQCLQEKTRASLSSWRPAWGQGKNYMILVQFERLGIHNEEGLLLASWTLEHHKKFVEAVFQLGGLENANEAGILRLMEEERRQGLTHQVVSNHLFGLRDLQTMTQEKIIGWEDYSRRNSLTVVRRKRQFHRLLSVSPYGAPPRTFQGI